MEFWKPILVGLVAAFGLAIIYVFTKTPRHDRDWQPHLSLLPKVNFADGQFSIQDYRDWTYSETDVVEQKWVDLPAHQIGDVRTAYLLVEPHPGLSIMAHTLAIFEFADGNMIGLTVEARKEADEKYSPFLGALRKYELGYHWASPRDLLSRRAVWMKRDLYLYKLELSQDEVEAYLVTLLEKTIAIENRPRFYSTLHSNCTNELAKSAGLPWQTAFLLTGKSAEALHKLGRIANDRPFEDVKAAAKIDDILRQISEFPHDEFHASLIKSQN